MMSGSTSLSYNRETYPQLGYWCGGIPIQSRILMHFCVIIFEFRHNGIPVAGSCFSSYTISKAIDITTSFTSSWITFSAFPNRIIKFAPLSFNELLKSCKAIKTVSCIFSGKPAQFPSNKSTYRYNRTSLYTCVCVSECQCVTYGRWCDDRRHRLEPRRSGWRRRGGRGGRRSGGRALAKRRLRRRASEWRWLKFDLWNWEGTVLARCRRCLGRRKAKGIAGKWRARPCGVECAVWEFHVRLRKPERGKGIRWG